MTEGQAQSLIVACEPKPGRQFADAESNIIVPDVIVQRSGRTLKVTLNPDVMPKLRINDLYAAAVRGQRSGSAAGLSSRLQEARWFMKNIQQRFDTILRVSKAIVERQKSFFTHGAIAMKPLVLREIADELGLHESTISRVTTAKYMATPLGTFELKYFFGSALATEAGGNASSTAVRALIRQLVAVEPAMLCYADFSATGRAALADFRRTVIEPANAAFRQGDDALGAALMTGGIHSAQGPAASGTQLQRRLQSALAMRMLALSSNEFPLLPPDQLTALPMPVLLLSGRQTPAIHAEVFRNVCAAMPQATVAHVDGAGHGVSRDQPEAFNRLALQFLLGR